MISDDLLKSPEEMAHAELGAVIGKQMDDNPTETDMRRQAIHFADDILVEEIIAMARDHGFHVRFVNGLTVVDRVPGIVKRDADKVLHMIRKAKA